MSPATTHAGETEVSILARILGNDQGQLPPDLARSLLDLRISDRDPARIHDVIVRNQADDLAPAEKEEMFAFVKAGTRFSIPRSKARRPFDIRL